MSAADDVDVYLYPKLDIAKQIFSVACGESAENEAAWQSACDALLAVIKENEMLPLYENYLTGTSANAVCPCPIWENADPAIVTDLRQKNADRLAKLDAAIELAEKEETDTDKRDALQAKADYYAQIGDKVAALGCYDKVLEVSQGIGHRLDVNFAKMRLGLFFLDYKLTASVLEVLTSLLEKQGDWDRRNRLKVYHGFHAMSVRDFSSAARLFLETASTFTATEIVSYDQFVVYTVYMAVFALDRQQLAKQVVGDADIAQSLRSSPLGQDTQRYLVALYTCQYAHFFTQLARVETEMRNDRYLAKHYSYYVREMKCKSVAQLLESYKSLTLDYLAKTFEVTPSYMQDQVATMIADGKLPCRIDHVNSVVVTTRPVDSKNGQYQAVIKQGDVLLNRVQKLSRVINY